MQVFLSAVATNAPTNWKNASRLCVHCSVEEPFLIHHTHFLVVTIIKMNEIDN